MTKENSDQLTPEQKAELEALAALPEDKINIRDIPEQRDWSGARRGALFSRSDIAAMKAKGEVRVTPADAPELKPDEAFWKRARIVESQAQSKHNET